MITNFKKLEDLKNELIVSFLNNNPEKTEADILNSRFEIEESNGVLFVLAWIETTNRLSHFYIKAAYKSIYENKPFYENKNVVCGYVYNLEDVKKEATNYIKSILKNLNHFTTNNEEF